VDAALSRYAPDPLRIVHLSRHGNAPALQYLLCTDKAIRPDLDTPKARPAVSPFPSGNITVDAHLREKLFGLLSIGYGLYGDTFIRTEITSGIFILLHLKIPPFSCLLSFYSEKLNSVNLKKTIDFLLKI
jgi:hypothetical protein